MKIIKCLLGLLLLGGSVFAQFRVEINYLTFHIPDDTSYLELQYLVPGDGLQYALKDNNKYQGSIIATVSVQPKSDPQTTIDRKIRFITDEYDNASPEEKKDNFFLTRIPLPKDEYTLYVCVKDEQRPESQPLCFSKPFDLRFNRNRVSLSNIQNIASVKQADGISLFNKNGMEIIPYFSNFYPENKEDLTFMQEVYNTDKIAKANQKCKIIAYIAKEQDADFIVPYKKIKQFTPTDKYVFLCNFKLGELPSGNYFLHTEVYDSKNQLLCSDSLFFQRSNPNADPSYTSSFSNDTLSRDTLLQYIDYLLPISNPEEVDFIRSSTTKDDRTLSDFFTKFWILRNPEAPWDAWSEYYQKVRGVNSKYSTLKLKGYRSDRGFYYLKYGAPNEMEFYPMEENMYPYEIWRYYQLEDQTNIYFIFGNMDLATKEYDMICSNKKDELYDPRWKLRLKPKDKRPFSIEETE